MVTTINLSVFPISIHILTFVKFTLKNPRLKASISPRKGIHEKNAIKLPYLSILFLKLRTFSFLILKYFSIFS